MANQTAEKQTILFSKLIPDFKHFVAKTNTRPALQNVYNNGQFTIATDSHAAVKVSNDLLSDNITENSLYNPKTDQYADKINYPDLLRIFPYESDTKIKLFKQHIASIVEALKEAKKIVKALKNKEIELTLSNNKLIIIGTDFIMNEDGERVEQRYEKSFDVDWNHEDLTLYVNCALLINSLSVMKKYLVNFDKDGYIFVEFYSAMRPILFTSQDEKFQTLLCPVRKIR